MKKSYVAIAMTLVVGVTLSVTAFAAANAGKSPTTVPGWGNGDKNHQHSGPPGQSVRPR